MRILVVEDDPHLGPSLKKGLEGNKYAVDLVEDGSDALFMSRTVTYDLLILDVRLPQLSGFEVCRKLRDLRPRGVYSCREPAGQGSTFTVSLPLANHEP